MNPGEPTGDAPEPSSSPQGMLDSIGFRLRVSFPDLLAIEPEEDEG